MLIQTDTVAQPRLKTDAATDTAAPALKPAKSSYLPTVDGWRALAILLVLLAHSPTITLGPVSTFRFHFLGDYGVRIFFAISGLLICSRLLDEEEKTGDLHMRGFYIRRVLRIQPPALAYLAAVALLMLFGRYTSYWGAFFAAVFLVRNYVDMTVLGAWPTAHFWSLSVEEHFYLFLPFFLKYCRRQRARILLTLAVLDMGWAFYELWRAHWGLFPVSFRTDTAVHGLLLAAAVAILLRRAAFKAWCLRYLHAWWLVPAALLATSPRMHAWLFMQFVPIGLVVATLLHPRGVAGRVLEWAPLRFIGRISFSLYLWQMIFLSGFFQPQLHPFGNMQRLWLVWPCTFAAALLSFYLVEKPCMRLGHRLARPATEGRLL